MPPALLNARRVPAWWLLLMAVVGACSGAPTSPTAAPPTPLTLPLQSELWHTIATPDPFPLSTNDAAQLEFEFPTSGSMHYLYTPSALAVLRGTLVVSLHVTTTGPVVFNSLDPVTAACSIVPSVRPFLWANDNGDGAYDRWWSNPVSWPLADGSATISVPLSNESWSSVNGKYGNTDAATRRGFARALQNVSRLGLTFGGGCSFGHGINVWNGRARFQLASYTIQ